MRLSTLLIAGSASLALAAPVQKEEKRASNFQFFGVNESGPEFGETKLPGTKNTDYVWPTLSTIDTFVGKGMNTFRVNILMERLTHNSMTASLDSQYLADLKTTVNYITGKGAYAMIVPHNYGRFNSQIITDTAGFKTWWTNVAKEFAGNSKVIFDINNEFHDMDQTLVVNLNQAGIDGIRAAGATSQYITAEGNSWTGAWTWTTSENGKTMAALKDPQNKLIYQMHQYLDSDGSGTNEACVSSTIGKERITAATKWLKDNGKKGLIGEFAGGNNSQCKTAVEGMLTYMQENKDVWTGALWWAAGPWISLPPPSFGKHSANNRRTGPLTCSAWSLRPEPHTLPTLTSSPNSNRRSPFAGCQVEFVCEAGSCFDCIYFDDGFAGKIKKRYLY